MNRLSFLSIPYLRGAAVPPEWKYLIHTFLTGIVVFTFFRAIAFGQEFYQLEYLPENGRLSLILHSFLMGFRFDIVTAGYLLILPFILLLTERLWHRPQTWLRGLAVFSVWATFLFAFFVCAADLPFFHHFNMRTNMAIFVSVGSGNSDFLWEMVWGEWRYYWALLPLAISGAWFLYRQWKLCKRYLFSEGEKISPPAARSNPMMATGMAFLLTASVWGQLSLREPLTPARAYFSDYGFPNLLALNPFYTLLRSWVAHFESGFNRVSFMPDDEAVARTREYLHIVDTGLESPIARRVNGDTPQTQPPNVVFVIMESMSAAKMGRHGNPNGLTPFLDSLAEQSLTFDSVFSVGIHTFAGIYATLFSMPVIKRKHPLVEMKPHAGIAQALKTHGYQTVYFTTHDEEFDNVGKFLRTNGFDHIVSKPDYPKDKVLSALGVPDDYLYHHAVGEFNELYRNGQPFFGAIMTGSDHGPYVIPDYFKPRHTERIKGVVEYVDWSVRQFLKEAEQQPWFHNTIFVFVGDHGVPVEKHYDLPLSFTHLPLIIYAPGLQLPRATYGNLGSQMDIFPTVMGLLKLSYTNNTLGIDLLREHRPYAICYADVQYAAIDKEYMYLSREYGVSSLYHYQSGNKSNLLPQMPERAAAMDRFAMTMFQTAQYLRDKELSHWVEP